MTIPFVEFAGVVTDSAARIQRLLSSFSNHFTSNPSVVVSSPGRTELVGNHTDHNGGKVVAASLEVDSLALAAPRSGSVATIYSRGWETPFVVDISSLDRKPGGHATENLLRGIAVGLQERGVPLCAFDAEIESSVLPGSGLSSSASIEMLLVEIFLALAEDQARPADWSVLEIARMGQRAENDFMGKPSGLMDQLACAHGGAIAIDFGTDAPEIRRVPFDPKEFGLQLAVVNSGGSHANLTPAYAAVPQEMRAVASSLGGNILRTISVEHLIAELGRVRAECGDRSVLRALHFYEENERVEAFFAAAAASDGGAIIQILNESGRSSWQLLQNVVAEGETIHQSVAVALALTDRFFHISDSRGACRVHGGGFAGTVLVLVQEELFAEYSEFIEAHFAKGAVQPLAIRKRGLVSARYRAN